MTRCVYGGCAVHPKESSGGEKRVKDRLNIDKVLRMVLYQRRTKMDSKKKGWRALETLFFDTHHGMAGEAVRQSTGFPFASSSHGRHFAVVSGTRTNGALVSSYCG